MTSTITGWDVCHDTETRTQHVPQYVLIIIIIVIVIAVSYTGYYISWSLLFFITVKAKL